MALTVSSQANEDGQLSAIKEREMVTLPKVTAEGSRYDWIMRQLRTSWGNEQSWALKDESAVWEIWQVLWLGLHCSRAWSPGQNYRKWLNIKTRALLEVFGSSQWLLEYLKFYRVLPPSALNSHLDTAAASPIQRVHTYWRVHTFQHFHPIHHFLTWPLCFLRWAPQALLLT